MQENKPCIKWINLARCIAISMVVLCHVTESIYSPLSEKTMTLETVTALSTQSKVACFVFFSFGRLGVPLFLMITGSLILPRDFNDDKVLRFWKSNLRHLLICTLVWFAIYDVYTAIFKIDSISLGQFIADLFFIHRIDISHAWYMPMILGFYILLPFVSTVLKNHHSKVLMFPLIVYSFYSFAFPILNVIVHCIYPDFALDNTFSSGFSGGAYGLYIIYGYLIGKGYLQKIKTIPLVCATIVAFALVVCFQLWSYDKGNAYNVWYDNLLLLITSIGIFELCSRIKQIKGYIIASRISYYSFAIYLIHNIVLLSFEELVKSIALPRSILVILFMMLCLTISCFLAFIISKIPKIGKYILYLK